MEATSGETTSPGRPPPRLGRLLTAAPSRPVPAPWVPAQAPPRPTQGLPSASVYYGCVLFLLLSIFHKVLVATQLSNAHDFL